MCVASVCPLLWEWIDATLKLCSKHERTSSLNGSHNYRWIPQTPFITRWCFAYTVLDILSRREWSAAARIWINLSLASVEQLLGWLLSLFCSAKSGGTGIARSVFYCSPIMLNRQMSCIFHNKIHVIWEMALLGVHSGNNCAAVQDRKRTPNGVNVTPVYSK